MYQNPLQVPTVLTYGNHEPSLSQGLGRMSKFLEALRQHTPGAQLDGSVDQAATASSGSSGGGAGAQQVLPRRPDTSSGSTNSHKGRGSEPGSGVVAAESMASTRSSSAPGNVDTRADASAAEKLLSRWSAMHTKWQASLKELKDTAQGAMLSVREVAQWHCEATPPGWELAHSKTFFENIHRCVCVCMCH